MRDAVQRMRLERRVAFVLLAAVLVFFALAHLAAGRMHPQAPSKDRHPIAVTSPNEADGQP